MISCKVPQVHGGGPGRPGTGHIRMFLHLGIQNPSLDFATDDFQHQSTEATQGKKYGMPGQEVCPENKLKSG